MRKRIGKYLLLFFSLLIVLSTPTAVKAADSGWIDSGTNKEGYYGSITNPIYIEKGTSLYEAMYKEFKRTDSNGRFSKTKSRDALWKYLYPKGYDKEEKKRVFYAIHGSEEREKKYGKAGARKMHLEDAYNDDVFIFWASRVNHSPHGDTHSSIQADNPGCKTKAIPSSYTHYSTIAYGFTNKLKSGDNEKLYDRLGKGSASDIDNYAIAFIDGSQVEMKQSSGGGYVPQAIKHTTLNGLPYDSDEWSTKSKTAKKDPINFGWFSIYTDAGERADAGATSVYYMRYKNALNYCTELNCGKGTDSDGREFYILWAHGLPDSVHGGRWHNILGYSKSTIKGIMQGLSGSYDDYVTQNINKRMNIYDVRGLDIRVRIWDNYNNNVATVYDPVTKEFAKGNVNVSSLTSRSVSYKPVESMYANMKKNTGIAGNLEDNNAANLNTAILMALSQYGYVTDAGVNGDSAPKKEQTVKDVYGKSEDKIKEYDVPTIYFKTKDYNKELGTADYYDALVPVGLRLYADEKSGGDKIFTSQKGDPAVGAFDTLKVKSSKKDARLSDGYIMLDTNTVQNGNAKSGVDRAFGWLGFDTRQSITGEDGSILRYSQKANWAYDKRSSKKQENGTVVGKDVRVADWFAKYVITKDQSTVNKLTKAAISKGFNVTTLKNMAINLGNKSKAKESTLKFDSIQSYYNVRTTYGDDFRLTSTDMLNNKKYAPDDLASNLESIEDDKDDDTPLVLYVDIICERVTTNDTPTQWYALNVNDYVFDGNEEDQIWGFSDYDPAVDTAPWVHKDFDENLFSDIVAIDASTNSKNQTDIPFNFKSGNTSPLFFNEGMIPTQNKIATRYDTATGHRWSLAAVRTYDKTNGKVKKSLSTQAPFNTSAWKSVVSEFSVSLKDMSRKWTTDFFYVLKPPVFVISYEYHNDTDKYVIRDCSAKSALLSNNADSLVSPTPIDEELDASAVPDLNGVYSLSAAKDKAPESM